MAFKTAAGHGNLPNGNFSPIIYSKKAQLAFRRASVIQGISNTDWIGELKAFGDTVRIMKEPSIAIRSYARGKIIQPQDIVDEDYTLVIDQANEFSFELEDIEESHSHINWLSLATDRAGWALRDQYDAEVLGYLSGFKQSIIGAPADTARTLITDVSGTKAVTTAGNDELLTTMKLIRGSFFAAGGDNSIPVEPRMPGAVAKLTDRVSPIAVIARMAQRLDTQNVPQEGRWLVIDPAFAEMLKDEDSRLFNADTSDKGGLRNGTIGRKIQGFEVYMSNSLPRVGTGPTTVLATPQNVNYGVLVAGHSSSVASAENLVKTENFRSQEKFSDVVRGLHVYGRKILRPEGIVTVKWNLAS
jgi:P22 coat protein - gene protein 5